MKANGAPTSCMISISSRRAYAASRTTLATVSAAAMASSATITEPDGADESDGGAQSTQPAAVVAHVRDARFGAELGGELVHGRQGVARAPR